MIRKQHSKAKPIYTLKWKVIRYTGGAYLLSTHKNITSPEAFVVMVETEDEGDAVKVANKKLKAHEEHITGIQSHSELFNDLMEKDASKWYWPFNN